jgi:hypothetical protein
MTNNGLRSFAYGMLFSVLVLGTVYYIERNHDVTTPITIHKQDAIQFLEESGFSIIPKEQYQQFMKLKANQKESAEKSENNIKKVYVYTITISEGMSSKEVSQLLEKAHIIDNAQRFDQYLQQHNLHKKIQVGTFEVTSEMNDGQLAKIITSK